MRVVATYPTTDAAYLAASRLESAGIDVEVRDEAIVSLNWMYALAIGGVKLAVVEADEADARAMARDECLRTGLPVVEIDKHGNRETIMEVGKAVQHDA